LKTKLTGIDIAIQFGVKRGKVCPMQRVLRRRRKAARATQTMSANEQS
jgi:hypothetical protein